MKKLIFLILLQILSVVSLKSWAQTGAHALEPASKQESYEDLLTLFEDFEDQSLMPILVEVDLEKKLHFKNQNEIKRYQEQVEKKAEEVLRRLNSDHYQVHRIYRIIPFIAVKVNKTALRRLYEDPQVISLHEDKLSAPTLNQSLSQINADWSHANGFSAAGTSMAILDTGVQADHDFLEGEVVAEACFSSSGIYRTSLCPSGEVEQYGLGSGTHCDLSEPDCAHGTHVAGIASAVAPDADLIAIQVFSKVSHPPSCEGEPDCLLSSDSDQIAALEWVYSNRKNYNIASANLSLGGGIYSSYCDNDPLATIIEQLKNVGVATVVSSGNGYSSVGVGSPGCISSAITVGAVDDNDQIASFSNTAFQVDLLAPGVSIYSSIPIDGMANYNGTSMAAPHVTGAVAILHQYLGEKIPQGNKVDAIELALESSTVQVTHSQNNLVKPRVDLKQAIENIETNGTDWLVPVLYLLFN